MAKPNEAVVESLVTAMLISLTIDPKATPSEVLSAVLTVTARMVRVVTETPGADAEALRSGLLQIWNILPPEVVVIH